MRAGKAAVSILIAAVASLCSCTPMSTSVLPSLARSVPTSYPPPNAATIYINYEHDVFVPASVTVPAGTMVIWQVSEDYAHHWVVCDAVPFRGWFYEWFPFKYIFTETGTYAYYDGANPDVTGSVIVY